MPPTPQGGRLKLVLNAGGRGIEARPRLHVNEVKSPTMSLLAKFISGVSPMTKSNRGLGRTLIVAILIGLVAGSAAGYIGAYVQFTPQIGNLGSQISTLTSERNSLRNQSDRLQTEVSDLQSRVNTLRSDLDSVHTQLEAAKAEISSLKYRFLPKEGQFLTYAVHLGSKEFLTPTYTFVGLVSPNRVNITVSTATSPGLPGQVVNEPQWYVVDVDTKVVVNASANAGPIGTPLFLWLPRPNDIKVGSALLVGLPNHLIVTAAEDLNAAGRSFKTWKAEYTRFGPAPPSILGGGLGNGTTPTFQVNASGREIEISAYGESSDITIEVLRADTNEVVLTLPVSSFLSTELQGPGEFYVRVTAGPGTYWQVQFPAPPQPPVVVEQWTFWYDQTTGLLVRFDIFKLGSTGELELVLAFELSDSNVFGQ